MKATWPWPHQNSHERLRTCVQMAIDALVEESPAKARQLTDRLVRMGQVWLLTTSATDDLTDETMLHEVEAARYLGINYRTLQKHRRARRIVAIPNGRTYVYTVGQLKELAPILGYGGRPQSHGRVSANSTSAPETQGDR